MKLQISALAGLSFATMITAKEHPTLPTNWISSTIDPPNDEGVESYMFASKPSDDQPSAMWSNYTGCQRLLFYDGHHGQGHNGRYYLGCDSLDCCYEDDGNANQIEFQIPNFSYSDPRKDVNVSYLGVQNYTSFGSVVQADEWTWAFQPPIIPEEVWNAFTVDDPSQPTGVALVGWQAEVLDTGANIQFKDFQGVADADFPAFKASFTVPDFCLKALNCPSSADSERLKYWPKKA
jgi:hypothetical protein